jgi:multicomponent Na+:H+ antiporter subunit A
MGILLAVLFGFVVALAAPGLVRGSRRASLPLLLLWPLGLLLLFGSFLEPVARGERVAVGVAWVPELGVQLSFLLDGLSLLFALLICGIGALVLIYTWGYLGDHPHLGRFCAFLLAFKASMLGLVLSDNLMALFIFWELTSISSYLLIGFDHEREGARGAAQQALLITAGGGLALLAGLLLLSVAGGSFELSELLARGPEVRAHALYLPILLLIVIGAFTKSAQFPFHFWLPGAMEAPTPVSAYLHSATMVKAGVYLLARTSPILGGTDLWRDLVTGAGAVTMLIGGVLALYRTDLKQILAYTTISALGTLTLLLGLGTRLSFAAAIVFLLAHALYKGALFMVAGAVDHETGTRDAALLRGLRRAMPVTAAAAVLAALSLAGLGPVFSFIGKELVLEAVQESTPLLIGATVFSGGLSVAVAAIVGLRPFLGSLQVTPRPPHEPPATLWCGPALLATLGVFIGVAPEGVARRIISPAVAALLGHPAAESAMPVVQLALWHGWNAAFAMSLVSLALGLGIYRSWEALRSATTQWEGSLDWGPARLYALSLRGLLWLASAQTRLLQSGALRHYLLVIILTTVALVVTTLVGQNGVTALAQLGARDLRFHEVVLAVVTGLAALAAVLMDSRLAAVAALGVAGYGVALIYLLFGAPDLAMTQFLIETLTVILFVLVFYHMPPLVRRTGRATRVRDALVALAAGGTVTTLLLIAIAGRGAKLLAPFYAEQSLPAGHGRNIVNVILVDFRAFDTLGEIAVLAAAGIGVYALLKLRKVDDRRFFATDEVVDGGSSHASRPANPSRREPGAGSGERSEP